MNIYLPVQNILKVATINTGGLCWAIFFRREDVAQWPEMNPETGLLYTNIILHPDAIFYSCQLAHTTRDFKETKKESGAGPFMEMELAGMLAGNNLNLITGIGAMAFHDYGVLFKERNGEQRLIGNADRGARFDWEYTSGNTGNSRLRNLKFYWEHHLPAPVYVGGTIVASGQVIDIATGNPITGDNSTQLEMLIEFEVGEVGSPMQPGDSVFTHPSLTGKNVQVFVNGDYLHNKPHPLKRYVIKAKGSNSLQIVGGVTQDETVSIYTFL